MPTVFLSYSTKDHNLQSWPPPNWRSRASNSGKTGASFARTGVIASIGPPAPRPTTFQPNIHLRKITVSEGSRRIAAKGARRVVLRARTRTRSLQVSRI
jgi:hypothetical protein